MRRCDPRRTGRCGQGGQVQLLQLVSNRYPIPLHNNQPEWIQSFVAKATIIASSFCIYDRGNDCLCLVVIDRFGWNDSSSARVPGFCISDGVLVRPTGSANLGKNAGIIPSFVCGQSRIPFGWVYQEWRFSLALYRRVETCSQIFCKHHQLHITFVKHTQHLSYGIGLSYL